MPFLGANPRGTMATKSSTIYPRRSTRRCACSATSKRRWSSAAWPRCARTFRTFAPAFGAHSRPRPRSASFRMIARVMSFRASAHPPFFYLPFACLMRISFCASVHVPVCTAGYRAISPGGSSPRREPWGTAPWEGGIAARSPPRRRCCQREESTGSPKCDYHGGRHQGPPAARRGVFWGRRGGRVAVDVR
jgi:hypothetical protein